MPTNLEIPQLKIELKDQETKRRLLLYRLSLLLVNYPKMRVECSSNTKIESVPMSKREIVVWQNWFRATRDDLAILELFNNIPILVLEHYEEVLNSCAFERFVALGRTDLGEEGMLIGIRSDEQHLIARWCSGGNVLVPFERVAGAVKSKFQKLLYCVAEQ